MTMLTCLKLDENRLELIWINSSPRFFLSSPLICFDHDLFILLAFGCEIFLAEQTRATVISVHAFVLEHELCYSHIDTREDIAELIHAHPKLIQTRFVFVVANPIVRC